MNKTVVLLSFTLLLCTILAAGVPANNGFESNKNGWNSFYGYTSITSDAYSGSKALNLRGFKWTDYLGNGGFEAGKTGWTMQVGNAANFLIVNDSDDGSKAAQLHGNGSETSIQSGLITVQGGKSYRIQARAKYVSGAGNYKVTIQWLNGNNHIRYDNDWKGYSRKTRYVSHGGSYTAPSNATRARIFVGVNNSTTIRFDSISFAAQTNLMEASCVSSFISNIKPGQLYKLTTWVKYISGTGRYKVTIMWFNKNKQLLTNWTDLNDGITRTYHNDWKGTDKPAAYKRHGYNRFFDGSDGFLPPDKARYAKIILGVQPGVEANFDEVRLDPESNAENVYLSNSYVKVGVSRKYGGAINFFSDMRVSPSKNLINQHDSGRLVQHSYFGKAVAADGVKIHPDHENIVWNPVQGGNMEPGEDGWSGGMIKRVGNKIITKCYPRNWNFYRRTKSCMSTVITLEDRAVKIVNTFKYYGVHNREISPVHDQETIAVYVIPALKWLKTYDGNQPFQHQPLPNKVFIALNDVQVPGVGVVHHPYVPKEYWAAWVNDNDYGVGAYSPDLKKHSTYHVDGFRSGSVAGVQNYSANHMSNDCNFFNLIPQYQIKRNVAVRETSYLIAGDIDYIRGFAYYKEGKGSKPNPN